MLPLQGLLDAFGYGTAVPRADIILQWLKSAINVL
jgi:hypothetical protein